MEPATEPMTRAAAEWRQAAAMRGSEVPLAAHHVYAIVPRLPRRAPFPHPGLQLPGRPAGGGGAVWRHQVTPRRARRGAQLAARARSRAIAHARHSRGFGPARQAVAAVSCGPALALALRNVRGRVGITGLRTAPWASQSRLLGQRKRPRRRHGPRCTRSGWLRLSLWLWLSITCRGVLRDSRRCGDPPLNAKTRVPGVSTAAGSGAACRGVLRDTRGPASGSSHCAGDARAARWHAPLPAGRVSRPLAALRPTNRLTTRGEANSRPAYVTFCPFRAAQGGGCSCPGLAYAFGGGGVAVGSGKGGGGRRSCASP
jgi:hypothetical protein